MNALIQKYHKRRDSKSSFEIIEVLNYMRQFI